MSKVLLNRHVSGFEAFNSEEFKTFARKFGISVNPKTVEITIHMNRDRMTVTQNYLGVKPIDCDGPDHVQGGDGE